MGRAGLATARVSPAVGQQEPRAVGGMQRETPPVSWSDLPASQTPKWIPTLGASRYRCFSPREPVVPPGGHTQLPAGHQLGTRVQQRAPRVRGAPGPGLGRQGRGVGACPGVGDLGGSGFLLWSPRCCLHGPPAAVGPGLQWVCIPGLGHRQQSPGQPQPEPGNCVSPHGCAAPGAQGAGLGLWHRGKQGWARGGCAGLGLRAPRALGWEAPGRAAQESNRLEGWSLPLDPWQPRVTPLSPFRGAGITCPSGPVPPGPPGARPRRQPASGEGSRASPVGPRRWPVPHRRPPIPSAAEAASPHLEQV